MARPKRRPADPVPVATNARASSAPKRDRSTKGRVATSAQSRILDVAIRLFAERGFDEVTVREIAEAAGANVAAINYYFGAKEQLIRQAIRSVIAPLNQRRLTALAAAQG